MAVVPARFAVSVLVSVAVLLYALEFVISLVLPSVVAIVLVLLFWALGILYQGMVVELVKDAALLAVLTARTLLGSRTGSGRRSKASAKLNIAEVAPIPIASEQIAIAVNVGFLRSILVEFRTALNIGPPCCGWI